MKKIITFLAISMCFVTEVRSQSTIVTLTRYEVKENFRQRFRRVVRRYEHKAHCYRSNVMAEAYYEQDQRHVLWTIERWSSEEKLKRFKNGCHGRRVGRLSRRALVASVKTYTAVDLEPLSGDDWKKKQTRGDHVLTIMLFVDCKPGTEESFKSIYHAAMPPFRNEQGVINYQLSQFSDDKTRFVTYEKFRSEEAFQYHLTFPPINPVVDFLNTNIEEQPFQKGLHRLIPF